ncbi:MAG: hypothetical protein ACYDA9_01855 [Terriglobia bacterium]
MKRALLLFKQFYNMTPDPTAGKQGVSLLNDWDWNPPDKPLTSKTEVIAAGFKNY